jgi:membrane-bound lytic murein transglycosylase D
VLVVPISAAARANPGASRAIASAAIGPVPVELHTVRSGESLWTISQRYRVTIAQLRTWNDMPEGTVLRPGQRLRVSVGS